MRAVVFDAPIPKYLTTLVAGKLADRLYVGAHACTRLAQIDAPALPADSWVRVRTTLGGICGSDLAIIGLETSPSTSPFSSFPFVLGHENVGVVAEVGRSVTNVGVGQRVTVNPLLCCEPRAVSPACNACAAGHHSQCTCFTDGVLPPGMFIGTTRSVGGSWGEEFVAHASQVVPLPDTLSDPAALLAEPFACCVHAVRRAAHADNDRVLVIGSGTMGLLTIAALNSVVPRAQITLLARHRFQGDHATRLGAAGIVYARGDYLGALADAAQTRLLKPIIGPRIGVGGFDVTYVCASNTIAINDALRFTRSGGRIMLLGNVSTLRGVDWTPVWLKELHVTGSLAYGSHGHGGGSLNAFTEAVSIIARDESRFAPLVTHTFGLDNYQQALGVARARHGQESVKVALDPQGRRERGK
jgi:threonine dehydrogenase-like Zn-dependent dehydrogenase